MSNCAPISIEDAINEVFRPIAGGGAVVSGRHNVMSVKPIVAHAGRVYVVLGANQFAAVGRERSEGGWNLQPPYTHVVSLWGAGIEQGKIPTFVEQA